MITVTFLHTLDFFQQEKECIYISRESQLLESPFFPPKNLPKITVQALKERKCLANLAPLTTKEIAPGLQQ